MNKYQKGYKTKSQAMTITQPKVISYAYSSGDINPIHINSEFAKKTMFKKTIAHGMMIGAFLGEMLFSEYGDVWLTSGSIDIKFKSPIYMDETIETYGEVVTSENNIIKLNVSITKNDGTEAIKGYATIKF